MGEQLWEQEVLLDRDRRTDRQPSAPSGDDSSGPRWVASPVPPTHQPHALESQTALAGSHQGRLRAQECCVNPEGSVVWGGVV